MIGRRRLAVRDPVAPLSLPAGPRGGRQGTVRYRRAPGPEGAAGRLGRSTPPAVASSEDAGEPSHREAAPCPLFTVGHGTHPAERFVELLREADVRSVVDVRIAPGSRRHPQFARTELGRWLPESGIDYRWDRRLGGFRKLPSDSPDGALVNSSFRAYAAHMRTSDFGEAMAELVTGARRETTAVMCSESVWWRCHRRLIADHATLVEGLTIRHLLPDGRTSEHRPTEGVRVVGCDLYYDAPKGAPPLPLPTPEEPEGRTPSRPRQGT